MLHAKYLIHSKARILLSFPRFLISPPSLGPLNFDPTHTLFHSPFPRFLVLLVHKSSSFHRWGFDHGYITLWGWEVLLAEVESFLQPSPQACSYGSGEAPLDICSFSLQWVLLAAHTVASTSEVAAAVTGPEKQILWVHRFRDQSLKTDLFLPILGMPVFTQRSSLIVEGRLETGRILWLIPSQFLLWNMYILGCLILFSPLSAAHSRHSKSRTIKMMKTQFILPHPTVFLASFFICLHIFQASKFLLQP